MSGALHGARGPGSGCRCPPPSRPPTVVITQASHWGALARGTCLTIRAARQGGAVLSGREAAQCRAVVGRNGARCLPGPPLVVAGGAAHATAHAPRRSRPHRPLRRGVQHVQGPWRVSSPLPVRAALLSRPLPQRPLPAPESPVLGAGACIPTWLQGAAAGADPAFVARAAVGRLGRQRR